MLKPYHELMEVIEGQNDVIVTQNNAIQKLLQANLEKENMIKELMKESLKNSTE